MPPSKDKHGEPTGRFAYDGLERVVHEKARLGIMTSLVSHPRGVVFADLKELCNLTVRVDRRKSSRERRTLPTDECPQVVFGGANLGDIRFVPGTQVLPELGLGLQSFIERS